MVIIQTVKFDQTITCRLCGTVIATVSDDTDTSGFNDICSDCDAALDPGPPSGDEPETPN